MVLSLRVPVACVCVGRFVGVRCTGFSFIFLCTPQVLLKSLSLLLWVIARAIVGSFIALGSVGEVEGETQVVHACCRISIVRRTAGKSLNVPARDLASFCRQKAGGIEFREECDDETEEDGARCVPARYLMWTNKSCTAEFGAIVPYLKENKERAGCCSRTKSHTELQRIHVDGG